jgi:hypothetical protein
MAKAKFILKEPNKNETLVYLFYNYQYSRFKYSTGEQINLNLESNKSTSKETKFS